MRPNNALIATAEPETSVRLHLNLAALQRLENVTASTHAVQVHRRLPGYRPTPLVDAAPLARRLGVAEVLIKDESSRLGLPAFKMLGASYAVYRSLVERLGFEPEWSDVTDLRDAIRRLAPITLCAATDGNHGRAVARMAALLGLPARVYVPEGTTASRIDAIKSEGAIVIVVPGDYDEAIRVSSEQDSPDCLVISDTSWPGYTARPRWVMEGYSTIFTEIDAQLARVGASRPDVVVVPVGVGALAAATVTWLKHRHAHGDTRIVGVEPMGADCMLRSIQVGMPVTVRGPHTSIMAGLNCGTPSSLAWPINSRGLDALVAIADNWPVRAMRDLAEIGVVAGETGAASLGGLSALCRAGQAACELLGIGAATRVLLICTEGVTGPGMYARLVGSPGGRP